MFDDLPKQKIKNRNVGKTYVIELRNEKTSSTFAGFCQTPKLQSAFARITFFADGHVARSFYVVVAN
jgi:hypothetical protein